MTQPFGAALLKYERGCLNDTDRITLFAGLLRTEKIFTMPLEYWQTARQLIADRKISPAGRILVRR